MAVGKAGQPANRDKLSISFNGIRVAKQGARDPSYNEAEVSNDDEEHKIADQGGARPRQSARPRADLRPHQGIYRHQRRLSVCEEACACGHRSMKTWRWPARQGVCLCRRNANRHRSSAGSVIAQDTHAHRTSRPVRSIGLGARCDGTRNVSVGTPQVQLDRQTSVAWFQSALTGRSWSTPPKNVVRWTTKHCMPMEIECVALQVVVSVPPATIRRHGYARLHHRTCRAVRSSLTLSTYPQSRTMQASTLARTMSRAFTPSSGDDSRCAAHVSDNQQPRDISDETRFSSSPAH